uniref:SKICH domain-containing protein n=1 Tax=Neogobius melanostomus TaxID=47308 RepID=A0A8C6SDR5_9GOBI
MDALKDPTRVECHYSLSAEHRWSSRDWIGIFRVGWTSINEYYTYTWVNVPENYTEGTSVDRCILFHGETLIGIVQESEHFAHTI